MPASSCINGGKMNDSEKKKVDETWKEKAKTEINQEKGQETKNNLPVADFKFFLTTLGMQAWIAMGMIPNPITEKVEESFGQAKFIIDTLEVLEKKTKGNLDKEEAELLEHLLYDLRLAYVEKTSKKA
jgi:hypothetical protein